MERVLFAVNAEEFGGLEVVLLDWLSGIDYSKISAALAYRSDVLKQRLALLNLPVETIKLSIPVKESSWKTFWNRRRVLSTARPDKIILLEGSAGDLSLAMILAARFAAGDVSVFAGGGGGAMPAAKLPPGLGVFRLKQAIRRKIRSSALRRNFVPS